MKKVKNIESQLKSNEYKRIKIGISNNKAIDTKDYVLGNFSKVEKDKFTEMQKIFNEIIESFVKVGIDRTMNIYNTKK